MIAFPRYEDVPTPPVLAHRTKMLPCTVTTEKALLPAILAGFWRDFATRGRNRHNVVTLV
jgi:hypothetical protein